jgi:hypothetical protein
MWQPERLSAARLQNCSCARNACHTNCRKEQSNKQTMKRILTSATHISRIWSAVYWPTRSSGSVPLSRALARARRPPPVHRGNDAARPRSSAPLMLALTEKAWMPGVWKVGLPADCESHDLSAVMCWNSARLSCNEPFAGRADGSR